MDTRQQTSQQLLEEIKQFFADFQQKKEAFTEALKPRFGEVFATIMAKGNRINSFRWEQYAPYFNDGEACVFSVCADEPDINIGEDEAEGDNTSGYEDGYNIGWANEFNHTYGEWDDVLRRRKILSSSPDSSWDPINGPVYNEIVATLQSLPDDMLQDMFGDDNRITVYRDGRVEVEDYSGSHD